MRLCYVMRQRIVLRDGGEGAYIEKWDHPDFVDPTDEQLTAALSTS